MRKYDDHMYGSSDYTGRPHTLNPLLNPNEQIIWEGKPNRRAYIWQKNLALWGFASFWLLLDIFILLVVLLVPTDDAFPRFFIFLFILAHSIPAWICIGIAFTTKQRWKRTYYMATTQKIIIRTGLVGSEYNIIYYPDISNVRLNIGILDRKFGVGDIFFHTKSAMSNGKFNDIDNPHMFFPVIQKIVMDIRTDMYYPNQLRPGNNPGYTTGYDVNNRRQ